MDNSSNIPHADKNPSDERQLLDRRCFLTGCAACAIGVIGAGGLAPRTAKAAGAVAVTKPKVKIVFSHPSSEVPIWPNIGYDFDKRKKELTEKLTQYCHGLDLTPVTVMNADQANTLTGRPGFISDPVIDTSKNQIIYAHCVGPTKVFGPGGPSSPFHIRSHSEDRKGASIRSLLPLGYMTTSLKINCKERKIILHQGKTIENIDEDKACRTKLAAEVRGDIEKLFCEWDRWDWHRVTFYGDIKPEIEALANALNFDIVEEA